MTCILERMIMKRLFLIFLFPALLFAKGHNFSSARAKPNIPEPRIIELDLPQPNTFCAAGLSCTVPSSWTFTRKATAPTNNPCASNGTFTVDTGNTCGWAGANAGAWINSAYAALPSSGGRISVSPGTYSGVSTAISFATRDKPVTLTCPDGVSSNSPATAPAVLKFTGTGTFITLDTGGFLSKIQGCMLVGPDGNTGTTTSGITVGGSTSSVTTTLDHVDISGFGNGGLVFANDAYIFTCFVCSIHDNGPSGGQNVVVLSGLGPFGENISFVGGSIYNSSTISAVSPTCFNIQTGGDFSFFGTSLDNCGLTINSGSAANTVLTLSHAHLETNISTTTDFISTGATANSVEINIDGAVFREGATSSRTEFISDNSTVSNHGFLLNVMGVQVKAAETVTNFFQPGTQCCPAVNVFGYQNLFGTVTNIVSSTGTGALTAMSDSAGDFLFGLSGKLGKLTNGNTSAQTYTFPNLTGTVVVSGASQVVSFGNTTIGAGSAITSSGAGGTMESVIASGTTSVTPGNSVGCTDTTAAASGAATTNRVVVSPQSPQGNTSWSGFLSASNTVDIRVCTIVALTGSATTVNWAVIQ